MESRPPSLQPSAETPQDATPQPTYNDNSAAQIQDVALEISLPSVHNDHNLIMPSNSTGGTSANPNPAQVEAQFVNSQFSPTLAQTSAGQAILSTNPADGAEKSIGETQRLRTAMDAQMLLHQQRERLSQQLDSSEKGLGIESAPRSLPIMQEKRPIPTQTGSSTSPFQSGPQTRSTDSTKTVIGIPTSTPGQGPKTPAYPFPSMSIGTPGSPYTGFHKPFTALSPTVGPAPVGIGKFSESREGALYDMSPSTPSFLPPGTSISKRSSDFPTPNLYNIMLSLLSEPGLDAWWTNLVQIMKDHYKAERVTLAVPADVTDLENVPWGQKATYNSQEDDNQSLAYLHRSSTGQERSSEGSSQEEIDPLVENNVPHTSFQRPTLESRHSFAGFESRIAPPGVTSVSTDNTLGKHEKRPRLLRYASHLGAPAKEPAPLGQNLGLKLNSETLQHHVANQESQQPGYAQLPGYSEPLSKGRVFPVLQALDYEVDSLIDSAGINKVLERGKSVVLSREYSNSEDGKMRKVVSSDASTPSKRPWTPERKPVPDPMKTDQTRVNVPTAPPSSSSIPEQQWSQRSRQALHTQPGDGHQRLSGRDAAQILQPVPYEEFEQVPSSPWSQSPAPSPAIQNEPEINPFFVNSNIQEASFDPTQGPPDYRTKDSVEAIGLDKATSIIHLPLIHPLLSCPGQASYLGSPNPQSPQDWPNYAQNTESVQTPRGLTTKKTPIAVLSLMSPVIPFPASLVRSLTQLAPHLATSFSIARQYTNIEREAAGLAQKRRGQHGSHCYGSAALDASQQLEELANVDYLSPGFIEGPSPSITGSVSSNEYSAVFRSPAGSLIGTPNWDPATMGLSIDQRSGGGTPGQAAGSDIIDSYFSSRKRYRANSSTIATQETPNQNSGIRSSQPSPRVSRHSPRSEKRDSGPDRENGSSSPTLNNRDDPYRSNKAVPTHSVPEEQEEYPKTTPKIGVARKQRNSSPIRRISDRVESNSPRRQIARHYTNDGGLKRYHTKLHSFGADFNATFQSLPSTAAAQKGQGSLRHHSRATSDSSGSLFEMPPPSEKLMRTIIDSLPVQIFTAAPGSGKITWVNSRFLAYRGETVENFLQNPWEGIHAEQRENYLKAWRQALRNGDQFSYQVQLRRFDGVYRWFYVRAAPLKDTRGVTVHWFGTNMDVHEQYLMEVSAARQKEVTASEARYRALANSSPQIVFAATASEGVTFANTQWLNYSGQKLESALGTGFMEHVYPDDLAKCKLPIFGKDKPNSLNVPTSMSPPQISRASSTSHSKSDATPTNATVTGEAPRVSRASSTSDIHMDLPTAELSELAQTGILKVAKDANGQTSYSTEVRLRNNKGDYRWHLVRCVAVDETDFGHGAGTWFGTCTDIDDHKLLEQKLQETMDSKTLFLSNMSHEIRTPLNGVTASIQFLLDTDLTKEQDECCANIHSSCDQLLGLINGILDLSKIEAGMMTITQDWFRIRTLAENVTEMLAKLSEAKQLELNLVVEDDVPDMVKGDPLKVRQVLTNTIGNAIKFTSHGEVLTRCSVLANEDGQIDDNEVMIKFDVVDTGHGFSEEQARRLFKPFSQIDASSTRQHGGTGLGLVISRQLVELHGGKMSATSVPEKGSTFTFSFRFQIPSEEDHPITPPPALPRWSKQPSLPSNGSNSSITGVPLLASMRALSTPSITSSPGEHPLPINIASTLPTTSHPDIADLPSPLKGDSPALESSGSSDPSIRSYHTGLSVRSSMSSVYPVIAAQGQQQASRMNLELPLDDNPPGSPSPGSSEGTARPSSRSSRPRATSISNGTVSRPPMYSVLVICPRVGAREATRKGIESSIPKNIPFQITESESILDCQKLIGGDDPVIFTHIVLNFSEEEGAESICAVMDQILSSISHPNTVVVVIADPALKKEVKKRSSDFDFDQLEKDERVLFVYKPIKVSRLQTIFDHGLNRESSNERLRDRGQRMAKDQREVFTRMEDAVGHRGLKILFAEDNKTNQMVLVKFLKRVGLDVDVAEDGVACTAKYFQAGHGHYAMLLVSSSDFREYLLPLTHLSIVRHPNATQRWLRHL